MQWRRDPGSVLTPIALAAFAALFFLYRLGELPVVLWDEARVAANALDMSRSGHLLVTTYDGQPDLWNTKPPLAIWLEAASLRAFGFSEFALRLPSALAAVATTLMVYGFTQRVSGSRCAGVLAALVLMGCAGYSGLHVARTADFDALLVLFTTAAAFSFWRALSEDGLSRGWLLATGAALALAVLTKGIAGGLILPGLAVYALWAGRIPRLLRSPAAWGAAALAIGLPLVFYAAREAAEPGFLQAMSANELGARFAHSIAGGAPSRWNYYLVQLLQPFPERPLNAGAFPWAAAFPIAACLVVTSREPRVRSAGVMCVVTIVAFLLVISAAATRLAWYAAPIFPLLAVTTALAARRVWSSDRAGLRRYAQAARATAALGIAVLAIAAVAVRNGVTLQAAPAWAQTSGASAVRAVLATYPDLNRVRVIHDGYGEADGRPYFGAVAFYVQAARIAGRDVRIEASSYRPGGGEALIWCPAELRRTFRPVGSVVLDNGTCRAVVTASTVEVARR